jgi:hypothetical protein
MQWDGDDDQTKKYFHRFHSLKSTSSVNNDIPDGWLLITHIHNVLLPIVLRRRRRRLRADDQRQLNTKGSAGVAVVNHSETSTSHHAASGFSSQKRLFNSLDIGRVPQ